MQDAVQMQVQPTMISRVEEQISLCSPRWTWNPKRSLTDLQSAELQDGPRTVTGEVRAIRGPSKKKNSLEGLNLETSEGSTHTHSMSLALLAVTCKGLTPNSTCDLKFNVSSPWSKSRKWEPECDSVSPPSFIKDWDHVSAQQLLLLLILYVHFADMQNTMIKQANCTVIKCEL